MPRNIEHRVNPTPGSKRHDELVEELKDLVKRQVDALDEVGPAVRKLDAGDALNKRDRLLLVEHLRLDDDQIEELHKADPDEARLERFFAKPRAFFYYEDDDGKRHQVFLEAGMNKPVDRDEDDPDFF